MCIRDSIHVARAQFYPNINLAAYIGQQALFANLLFKNSSQIGSVGPAVSLPIFEGGRLRDQYRGARSDYDDAVASYDATLVQALQELADAAASERALGVSCLLYTSHHPYKVKDYRTVRSDA